MLSVLIYGLWLPISYLRTLLNAETTEKCSCWIPEKGGEQFNFTWQERHLNSWRQSRNMSYQITRWILKTFKLENARMKMSWIIFHKHWISDIILANFASRKTFLGNCIVLSVLHFCLPLWYLQTFFFLSNDLLLMGLEYWSVINGGKQMMAGVSKQILMTYNNSCLITPMKLLIKVRLPQIRRYDYCSN